MHMAFIKSREILAVGQKEENAHIHTNVHKYTLTPHSCTHEHMHTRVRMHTHTHMHERVCTHTNVQYRCTTHTHAM